MKSGLHLVVPASDDEDVRFRELDAAAERHISDVSAPDLPVLRQGEDFQFRVVSDGNDPVIVFRHEEMADRVLVCAESRVET